MKSRQIHFSGINNSVKLPEETLDKYIENLAYELSHFMLHNVVGQRLQPIYDTLNPQEYSDYDLFVKNLNDTVLRMVNTHESEKVQKAA